MSRENRGIIAYTGRMVIGLGLVTAGCVDEEGELPADEDELEWRITPADPPLPLSASEVGPSPSYVGVVSACEPIAAEVGRQILADGGNAVDAAIAVQFALNVVDPQSSGVGGGGIMLIHEADTRPGDTVVLDFRDVSPKAITSTTFAGDVSIDLKDSSGYTVGTPGTVRGMSYAHKNYGSGKFTLAQLLAPAIRLARDGFPVSSVLASATGSSQLQHEYTANSLNRGAYAVARAVFRPGGSSLKTGAILKQPDLAKAFELIAKDGEAAFYDCASPLAQAIVSTQLATRTSNPSGYGRMNCADDLAKYAIKVHEPGEPDQKRAPIIGAYHGYTVVTTPPPTSGVYLMQMLDILETLQTTRNVTFGKGSYTFGSYYMLNVLQEAMRLAFADRAKWLGDPGVTTYRVPSTELLDPTYISQRAALITPGSRRTTITYGTPPSAGTTGVEPASEPEPAPKPGKGKGNGNGNNNKETLEPEGSDTTHWSVIDQWGNAVSVTSTVSDLWGTGLMVKGWGFMLNNQLLNFNDSPVNGPNDAGPYKRPRTTLSPLMLFIGNDMVAAYGSPGGTDIINALLQVTINLIDHRLTLKNAITRPRIAIDSPSPSDETEIESGFSTYVANFSSLVQSPLTKLGYSFKSVSSIGAVQAVMTYLGGGLTTQYGAADPRRGGGVGGN